MQTRYLLGLLLVSACPGRAQSFNPAPVAGEKTVTIVTAPAAAGTSISVLTAADTNGCSGSGTPVALDTKTDAEVGAGANTTLALAAPLAAGGVICAKLGAASVGSVTVGEAPVFKPAPVAGDKTVTIATAAIPSGSKIALFTAATADACNGSSTPVPLAPYTNTQVLAGANTTLTLATPLVQGEVICATLGNTLVKAVTVAPSPTPPGFDWGLVRAYFTFGGLVSQSDGQFSHTDLFMDFHLDKTYFQLGNLDDSKNHSFWPGLNSFFDTRLTALPVAVQPCTSSSSSGSTSQSGCSSNSSGSSSSSSSSSATTPTQVFLNSQKSARLQFGVYTPFTFHRWHVDTKSGAANTTTPIPYALYIAPLVKGGFDTSVNGLNQTQQNTGAPSLVQPIGTSGSFYKFYDMGFRLGHYQLSGDPTKAPDILSYLDVGYGRFSNMASLLCPKTLYNGYSGCNPPAGSTTPPVLPWTHDWRLSLEGLLEVPASKGFSIGFSANISKHTGDTTLNGTHYTHIFPQDDLRFLFAYRFDISSIATKLAGQSQ